MENRTYIAIDLKSFYASVECVERGLDPITTRLVVADEARTEKTICLAVSPALKKYGIPGRARLFEVVQKAGQLHLDYIVAKPRMALYLEYSTKIYEIYLRYIAPEDIHVYSIDEVFMDVTQYLDTYKMTAKELASKMIRNVSEETGIMATAGIGTNMYLCKVALDITAKHIPPDKDGVRIAELDMMTYRRTLWTHKELTDFWMIGAATAKRLNRLGMFTMGDVARCSLQFEDILYKEFGKNAAYIIDQAWGREPVDISSIKAYKPEFTSTSSGQVLTRPYNCEETRIIIQEMVDKLVLELVEKGLTTDQIVMTVGYDIENLTDPDRRARYRGEVVVDRYGRQIPKHAHGTAGLGKHTSSTRLIMEKTLALFDRIINPDLLTRRLNITANRLLPESEIEGLEYGEQLSLFEDPAEADKRAESEAREKKMQKALLKIKNRYGANAVLKGTSYQEGATAKERNQSIGGHKA